MLNDKIYRIDLEKKSNVQIAFVIILINYILNPKKKYIKIKEDMFSQIFEIYIIQYN